jgi:hypothetical protein
MAKSLPSHKSSKFRYIFGVRHQNLGFYSDPSMTPGIQASRSRPEIPEGGINVGKPKVFSTIYSPQSTDQPTKRQKTSVKYGKITSILKGK